MKPLSANNLPSPIRCVDDVPQEIQHARLTIDDSVQLATPNVTVTVGKQYVFGHHAIRVEQIIRKAPFEESDRVWGMIQVYFIDTRQKLSYVFSAEWAHHLHLDPTPYN